MQTSILPVISECIIAFNLALQRYITIGPCIGVLSGYTESAVPHVVDFWHAIIHSDDLPIVEKVTGKLTEGEAIEINYRILPPHSLEVRYITEKRSIYTDGVSGQQILLSILNEHAPDAVDAEGHARSDALKREQYLLSLINSQTNFLIRLDRTGHFTFVNKRYCKIFGYSPDELLGHHFAINTAPEDMERCQRAFEECLASPGKIIPLIREKLDKGGKHHPTEWEFVSVVNERGEVSEIQGIGQDISEKLEREKEAKQSAEQLDHFIESITDSFVILDTEWRFIKTNKAFETISNRTHEQLTGNVIWDVFPILIGGQSEQQFKRTVQYTEYVESSNLWFRITVYPSAEGLTVFIKNITEQKFAEEELNRARNNLESLINNTNDLVWSIDINGHYIYINNAYKNAVFKEAGIIPANGGEVIVYGPEETREAWTGFYRQALDGENYTIIYENTHSVPGETFYYEVNFYPIYNNIGVVTGAGCFAREITSRLESEREIIDQNERLRHIASLSSHELRRPVASMLGLINLIDFENFNNPENKEAISLLLAVGNEIDHVIRTIVDNTFTGLLPNLQKAEHKQ
jgi:PAS domain S-box-containing protein